MAIFLNDGKDVLDEIFCLGIFLVYSECPDEGDSWGYDVRKGHKGSQNNAVN